MTHIFESSWPQEGFYIDPILEGGVTLGVMRGGPGGTQRFKTAQKQVLVK